MAGSATLTPPARPAPAPEKTRRNSRKNAGTLLLRPASESGWELWATGDGEPREISRFETLPDAGRSDIRIIAIPAQYVLVFSKWLQTADDSLLADMGKLLLERQGIAPREDGGESFSFTTVLKEEQRTLVAVRLLSGPIPAELCLPQVERFEVGADLQPIASQGLTLWREAGRIVAAFSRDGVLIHLQSFFDTTVTAGVAAELLCTRLSLETEEMITADFGISLLNDFSEDEKSLLAALLGCDPQTARRTLPILPRVALRLTPPLVEVMRQKNLVRQRIERLLWGAAAVYALLLLGLILNVAWITYRNRASRKAIAADQATVDSIRSTETRWKAIEAAVNPAIYPVEVLFQAATLLPDDGIRFTLFEENQTKVTIRGEANSAAAAFKLVEALKSKDDLNSFSWEMPKPNILPNDKAEFLIQGNLPDARPH